MSAIKSVTVYCGSSSGVNPANVELARKLGVAIAKRGWRLVYGGGNVGLMGQCSSAAHAAGGKVLGVMPYFLKEIEGTNGDIEHWFVDTMQERKKILLDEADAFVVLPGGIGTLEEAVENLSWSKLSLHRKPMAFLSEDGYWAPFFVLMDHIIQGGFSPGSMMHLIADTSTPEEALDELVKRVLVLG